MHDIQDKNIDAPPDFKSASGHHKYISGLGKVGQEVKILLDVDKILFEEEITVIKDKI